MIDEKWQELLIKNVDDVRTAVKDVDLKLDASRDASQKNLDEKFEKLSEKLDLMKTSVNSKISELNNKIVILQVKAGIWGALAGLIPFASFLLYTAVKGL